MILESRPSALSMGPCVEPNRDEDKEGIAAQMKSPHGPGTYALHGGPMNTEVYTTYLHGHFAEMPGLLNCAPESRYCYSLQRSQEFLPKTCVSKLTQNHP